MKKMVRSAKIIFINFFLFLVLFATNIFGQSVQNFGTSTGSLATGASTSIIPNPTTSGSTYARIGSGNGSINMITSPNPLGTSGTFIRASAPTNSSVNKISPIIGSTGGTTFYSRFKVIFGDALAGSSATSGEWYAIFGDGSTFGNSSTFNSSQTFSGFRFTYGAGGNITFDNRNGSNWDQSSINSAYSTLKSGIYYDFEIVGNNKSSGTVNYAYNGVSQSVAINRFDLYINGFLVGNELSKAQLANNASIKSVMFYGRNSTSNVANIFLDDVSFQNSIPTSIQRLTNPSSFDLSASNYSFTDWPSTSSIGTYPSNMIFHWGTVNSVDPTLPNTATQDYVWGYNYTDQSRITGLGANGFSFINSSPGRVSTTSGNCGEAVVSLKTSCRNNVQVSWTAARLTNNGIRYLLRAQYRVGNTGAYTDLPGATSAIEFNSANAGPTNFGPITLPSACENQPEVQIRWVYYSSGSGSGSRDEIRLDDISISSSSLTAAPTGNTAQSFCSANSPTIANLIATGTSIKWYAAVSGGSALLSSVSLVTGTTYYATQTVNGCESTSRFAVTATINSNPSAPTGTATQSFYSASYPTIANLSATGTSKKWYSVSSGGSELLTSLALANGTTYYATQTVNGCESTSRFAVTATLSADLPSNVSACDSYILPALSVGNYFTGSNGTGTALSAGTVINASQTLYVYVANGSYSNENSFEITINATPTADSPSNVSVCDSYTLPTLSVGNYFTGSNGTGTALSAGYAITSSQTIYVYAQNGTCTDENSFNVTINTTPSITGTLSASRCDAGTLTLEATPSAGTINWFTAAAGGSSLFTGTIFTTPSISTTTTYFAQVDNGSCTNNTRTAVIAIIGGCSKIQASQCGTTLANNTSAILATTVVGATNYRFEISGPNGYLEVLNSTSRWFYLSSLPSYELGQTYSIRVQTSVNGGVTYREYGQACTITTFFPTTQLQSSQCGATLTSNASAIIANTIVGATNYRFEVSGPNGYLQTVTTTSRWFYLSNLPSYDLGQTYSVRVQTSYNNGASYGPYGSSCNITTFFPTTQLPASQCGITLTTDNSAIVANLVTDATNYRFEVTGPNGYYQLISKTIRQLYLSDLATYERGQTYSFRVCLSFNNGLVYGPFGSTCNITTSHPRTQIQTSQCGATLTNNTTAIAANSITGVANYRFEVSGPNGYLQVVTKTVRQLFLSDLPSYELGQTYSIRIQLRLTNAAIYGPYGTACNITTASTMPLAPNSNIELKSMNEPTFDFEAFPNPSNGDFTISSSEAGTFNIINELGQLVRTVEITEANGNQERVENMPNGAYFVTGTLNGEVVTKKVMVVR